MSLSAHEELLMLRRRARRRLIGAIVLVGGAVLVLWNVLDRLPPQEMKPQSVEITGLPASAAVSAEPAAPVASGPHEPDILAVLPPEDAIMGQGESSPPQQLAPPPVMPQASAPVVPAAKPAVSPVPLAKPPVQVPAATSVSPAVSPPKVESKPVAKPEPKPVVKPAPAAVKPPVVEKKPEPAIKPDPMAILEGRDSAGHAQSKPADFGSFNVQLAALSDPEKVGSLRQRLSAIGVHASFSKVQTSKGEVTRVRIGPFATRAEADVALRKLERAGVTGIIVNK